MAYITHLFMSLGRLCNYTWYVPEDWYLMDDDVGGVDSEGALDAHHVHLTSIAPGRYTGRLELSKEAADS
ncbi:hypothetical protein CCHR01_18938 [Colletotrichum chrysophilum]|uniref:Uncharacterized protein n=1 Tax=Colletotrichum chrysophilum TaxID=1836956 RepID=A0AAD8ZZE2_9PEZI|nr:hypothetical protein CCHR01_18938 [Colletotrichum chrysophilum]